MTDFADAKHRPHAVHTGEEPRNEITYGPESLSVTLDRWGPVDNLFTSMYDALQANWGDVPSRTVDRPCTFGPTGRLLVRLDDGRMSEFASPINDHAESWEHRTGWCKLEDHERTYVESCFAGKTLQQVLEGITFDFCIDGVSRAFTHQNVRTRLGAGFMQHGGRDNDWRHRPWTMPETMRRMCVAKAEEFTDTVGVPWTAHDEKLEHCITDWKPIDEYLATLEDMGFEMSIEDAIKEHIMNGRMLYSALVDAGIPWQDARRVLFIGMQTYIHDQYNYLALAGVLANRLEHMMDWEFNCVAQLMLREVKMKCPPLISKYLGSHSDKAKSAKFAGLESWPPDRKYPSPYDICKVCKHTGGNHYIPRVDTTWTHYVDDMVCRECEREGNSAAVAPMHRYEPVDTLQRQHRPEQMPFFVLHPDSMVGGSIQWIPTNGQYPQWLNKFSEGKRVERNRTVEHK